jgi:CHASE2 domain-containing sensor protein
MKYFLKRDTIFATIGVFFVMWLLSLIPINTSILDPLKLALSDINFNDLSFSAIKKPGEEVMDDKIVVLNIDDAGRAAIASVIKKTATAQPAVIGLDVLFHEAKETAEDNELAEAIRTCSNIVISESLEWSDDSARRLNYFSSTGKRSGYVNFIGEHKGVIRFFSPYEKTKDSILVSFAAAVATAADAAAGIQLEKRGHETEMINYKKNASQFVTVYYKELLYESINPAIFKDKVVLIGYVNSNPFNIEDKHFTPLNEKFTGKSVPDMNGVIIHANIVSMILNETYINKLPLWASWIFTFCTTWLFMSVIIRYYLEKHIWFHLAAKSIQLLLAVILVYMGIFFLRYTHLYISFGALLFAVMLSVDILYFYEGLAVWLHKKFGFKTLFHKKGYE